MKQYYYLLLVIFLNGLVNVYPLSDGFGAMRWVALGCVGQRAYIHDSLELLEVILLLEATHSLLDLILYTLACAPHLEAGPGRY